MTELSLARKPRARISALITPLHCSTTVATPHINKEYLDAVDRLIPDVDVLFGIMGEYWWDQWANSAYSHWLPKMVRLDMAVDTTCFPPVKTHFNPPGKRGFLYIGSNRPEKGTSFLSRLRQMLPTSRWGWIGAGPDIEGIKRLSTSRHLTPDYMRRVARDFDIFVNASIGDANPTTVLESMAWGFPVVCTPQSGYYETSYRWNIYHDDLERSVGVLRGLDFAECEALAAMALEARLVVERDYTWGHLTQRVCEHLGLTR